MLAALASCSASWPGWPEYFLSLYPDVTSVRDRCKNGTTDGDREAARLDTLLTALSSSFNHTPRCSGADVPELERTLQRDVLSRLVVLRMQGGTVGINWSAQPKEAAGNGTKLEVLHFLRKSTGGPPSDFRLTTSMRLADRFLTLT